MPRERNADYQRSADHIAAKCHDGKWKLYIIAAEGDKREYKYFNTLIKTYKEDFDTTNLHVEFIDREQDGNSDPQYVYATLKTFCTELEKKYQLKEYDELWLVIDTDDYDNRQKIISKLTLKCSENTIYKLCISNPCFEIWLILHFVELGNSLKDCIPDESSCEDLEDYDTYSSKALKEYIEKYPIKQRPRVCKQLLPHIHKDRHQPFYEKLITYIPQAIRRAKKLGSFNPTDDDYPQKIGTQLH